MSTDEQNRLDQLWEEYGRFLNSWDDLSLARWMVQTLAQLQGRAWRLSHPLVGAYRLAATAAHKRGLRVGRLTRVPMEYADAPCCGAPLLPLVTRDVHEEGLLCYHCHGKAIPFEEIPEAHQEALEEWAREYAEIHAVAHWTDQEREQCRDYDKAYNQAAEQAEQLLHDLAVDIIPSLLESYPALVWEDHDECLDVRADDITF
jgi:hypothetical protein